MSITITPLTNTDTDFYTLMGPFLANRDVVKQVGDKIWDDEGKTWYIAREAGKVVGFVAVTQKKTTTLVESLYLVDPTRTDIAAALITQATKDFGHDRDLQVTVITTHTHAYTEAGFVEISPVGKRFTKLVRRAGVRTTSKKKGRK